MCWNWEIVKDWNDRIKDYSEEQKKFYAQMIPLFADVDQIEDDKGDDWSSENSKDVRIEIKKSQRGMMMYRAWGTINWPVLDVYRCMSYFPLRSEWDTNTDYAEHLKKVGVNAFISYSKSKKQYVVSSRDFVVNYLCNREEDGTIRDVVTSENVQMNVPEKPSTVRAFSKIVGVTLRPDPVNA